MICLLAVLAGFGIAMIIGIVHQARVISRIVARMGEGIEELRD